MNIPQLKKNAKNRMAQAGQLPRKLTFISVGISLVAAVAVGLVGVAVTNYQGGEGLSGMGTATLLQAVEQSLNILLQLLSPFWTVGLVAALFAIANGQEASEKTLLQGFRRFGPFLRLYLLKALLIFALAIALYFPAVVIYSLTPWGMAFQTMLTQDPEAFSDIQTARQLLEAIWPMLVVYGLVLLGVMVPVLYRLRFAQYFLVAGWKGAMLAMACSFRQTKGRVKDMLKLDLSFWWYYVADVLLLIVCYLDIILGLFGIRLPMDAQTTYWICYAAYGLGHLALEIFARPNVEGARVFFFRGIAYSQI